MLAHDQLYNSNIPTLKDIFKLCLKILEYILSKIELLCLEILVGFLIWSYCPNCCMVDVSILFLLVSILKSPQKIVRRLAFLIIKLLKWLKNVSKNIDLLHSGELYITDNRIVLKLLIFTNIVNVSICSLSEKVNLDIILHESVF